MARLFEFADLARWRADPPALPGGIYRLFQQVFLRQSAKVALETPDGQVISFAELESAAERCRATLAACGVAPGDRVLAYVAKSTANVFLYLACLRHGAVYVPVNPAYTYVELAEFVKDARPRLVVCDLSQRAQVAELVKGGGALAEVVTLQPDGVIVPTARSAGRAVSFGERLPTGSDPAVILYTSGTTGTPRGAVLAHRALAANALALCRAWDFRSGDILVHALPLFHTHGLLVALHCALLTGASILFLPVFDPAAAIKLWERATVFMGVPTYYARLLAHPALSSRSAESMRLFTCGSASLLPQIWEEFHQRSGHRIVERYGMTEVGIITSNPYHGARVPGSVGYPLQGVEIRVVNDAGMQAGPEMMGELRARSAGAFSGYLDRPAETAEVVSPEGWVSTGDLAVLDSDGRVRLVGRSKDVIITGGLNVHPQQVESALNSLPGVVESAVFGAPHPDFGEGVVAALVWDGEGEPSSARLLKALSSRLAGYKIPKRILIVDSLPRNAMGKVQKTVLRSRNVSLFTSRSSPLARRGFGD